MIFFNQGMLLLGSNYFLMKNLLRRANAGTKEVVHECDMKQDIRVPEYPASIITRIEYLRILEDQKEEFKSECQH